LKQNPLYKIKFKNSDKTNAVIFATKNKIFATLTRIMRKKIDEVRITWPANLQVHTRTHTLRICVVILGNMGQFQTGDYKQPYKSKF
jgi:hypothetical protein